MPAGSQAEACVPSRQGVYGSHALETTAHSYTGFLSFPRQLYFQGVSGGTTPVKDKGLGIQQTCRSCWFFHSLVVKSGK